MHGYKSRKDSVTKSESYNTQQNTGKIISNLQIYTHMWRLEVEKLELWIMLKSFKRKYLLVCAGCKKYKHIYRLAIALHWWSEYNNPIVNVQECHRSCIRDDTGTFINHSYQVRSFLCQKNHYFTQKVIHHVHSHVSNTFICYKLKVHSRYLFILTPKHPIKY